MIKFERPRGDVSGGRFSLKQLHNHQTMTCTRSSMKRFERLKDDVSDCSISEIFIQTSSDSLDHDMHQTIHKDAG